MFGDEPAEQVARGGRVDLAKRIGELVTHAEGGIVGQREQFAAHRGKGFAEFDGVFANGGVAILQRLGDVSRLQRAQPMEQPKGMQPGLGKLRFGGHRGKERSDRFILPFKEQTVRGVPMPAVGFFQKFY